MDARQYPTYVFVIRQIVEVRARDKTRAEEVLRAYPPMRELNGTEFSIQTRPEIEVYEPSADKMP